MVQDESSLTSSVELIAVAMESIPPLDNHDGGALSGQFDLTLADARPLIVSPGRGPSQQPIVIPTERDSDHYVLDGQKKVIIFNHKEFRYDLHKTRWGTDVDVESIKKTFYALNWDVELHQDLTVDQIREIIKKIKMSKSSFAALAIFILSHGDNGTVFAWDYPFRLEKEILANLAGDKCPVLAGKPKLVFVQTCQGHAEDPGTAVTGETMRRRRWSNESMDSASSISSTEVFRIPNYADFFILHASFFDHVSYRSPKEGTWFIQTLCRAIDSSQSDEALHDVCMTVRRNVALEKESEDKMKQVPVLFDSTLRKIFFKISSNESSIQC